MNIADERSGGRVADEAQGPHTRRQLYNPAHLIRGTPDYLRPATFAPESSKNTTRSGVAFSVPMARRYISRPAFQDQSS